MSSRSPNYSPAARRVLPPAIFVLLMLGLLPGQYVSWVGSIGGVVTAVVAPISQTMTWIAGRLRPAESRDPAAEAALKEKSEHFEFLYRQQLDQNHRLKETIAELQLQRDLAPDMPIRLLTAPVIGGSSDPASGVLRVKVGSLQGVSANTVATVRGLQLLGRVSQASARTCLVQPITRKAAGPLRGRIIIERAPDAAGPLSLICLLEPIGDGTLRGEVEFQRAPDSDLPLSPTIGQTVRLDDDRWPASAQMLRIGLVEAVAPSPANPQRQIVTVRPAVPRLDRVTEVVLRVIEADSGSEPKSEKREDGI